MTEQADKYSILSKIPLFAGLKSRELAYIENKYNIIEYKKGQLIYEEGFPASCFYCIVLGRVFIFTRDRFGTETPLEYLHRGKYFGIISLLTGDTHSVSARAMNDCSLLEIKKEDFNLILQRIPQLALDLSRSLSRRLKNKDIHQKTIFESTVISVFSSYSQAGKTVYALNLALSLRKETNKSVIILDVSPREKTHSLPQRLGIGSNYQVFDLSSANPLAGTSPHEWGSSVQTPVQGSIAKSEFGIDAVFFTYDPEDEASAKKLVGIFTLLVNDYNYIILDLPSSMDEFVLKILNQSDTIHILTSPEPVDLTRTRHLIERLKSEFHFHQEKIKVIINECKLAKLSHQEQMELLGYRIFGTLPRIELMASDRMVMDEADSEYARAMRRISRQIGESFVGLALGVGVAYGFCHIGVLKVIAEEKIPIDVIAGSSMGAIIAGLWATGRSAGEILEITQTEFKEPKHIWGLVDLTLPLMGFIKGNKLYSFLKKYFGNKTFFDIKLPLKIVASNIRKKEPLVIERGPLVDALMASCSMPGVFTPFRFREEILYDGGIIHPLPTEPLFMMGVKKIIAVNVTPSRNDIIRQHEKLKADFSSADEASRQRRWLDLKGYLRDRLKVNILETVFASIEFMQSELAQREAQFADIVLHPDTQGMHWLELSRAREFAKKGEEEARKNLDKIWKLVNE